MEPIDRVALREMAERATPGPWGENAPFIGEFERAHDACYVEAVSPAVVALLDALDAAERERDEQRKRADIAERYGAIVAGDRLADVARAEKAERERDAYKRAKGENDDRFLRERDEARRERDEARADFVRFADHESDCDVWQQGLDTGPTACTCGYYAALARAEGRG